MVDGDSEADVDGERRRLQRLAYGRADDASARAARGRLDALDRSTGAGADANAGAGADAPVTVRAPIEPDASAASRGTEAPPGSRRRRVLVPILVAGAVLASVVLGWSAHAAADGSGAPVMLPTASAIARDGAAAAVAISYRAWLQAASAAPGSRVGCFLQDDGRAPAASIDVPAYSEVSLATTPAALCAAVMQAYERTAYATSQAKAAIAAGTECGGFRLADQDGGATYWYSGDRTELRIATNEVPVSGRSDCGPADQLLPLTSAFADATVCATGAKQTVVVLARSAQGSGSCPAGTTPRAF